MGGFRVLDCKMPRKPRLYSPGSLNHIISRGNRHQAVFESPTQYEDFLGSLEAESKKGWIEMHGNALMPNHWHGIAREGPVPIGRVMQAVLTKFAVRSNKFNGRSGHVFQGRFKSYLIRSDEEAKEVLRYIHYNPVRARLVEDPAQWRWSSHGEYAGTVTERLTATGLILSSFSPDTAIARAAYLKFMSQPPPQGVRPDCIPTLDRLAGTVERQSGLPTGSMRNGPLGLHGRLTRDRFIRLAAEAGVPARYIAAYLKVSPSTIFSAIRS